MPITTPRKGALVVELGHGDVGISTLTLDVGVAVVMEGLACSARIGDVAGEQVDAESLAELEWTVADPSVVIYAMGVEGLDVLIAKLEQARSALVAGGPRVA